ncbi:hypothetical protein L2E82_22870 [Cichorium intybus]|uniref:Uncharacterized protein n=1 Tax=Cichorium intybus TaxID=13427 RepID=A0ACB9DYG1_CICIN|nr:hypothetical protein L2E82_22870 [Cichorium intybus]
MMVSFIYSFFLTVSSSVSRPTWLLLSDRLGFAVVAEHKRHQNNNRLALAIQTTQTHALLFSFPLLNSNSVFEN